MESQIFTWDGGWGQHDTMGFIFHSVTLVVDVGPYKAGTKFKSASLDYYGPEGGKIALYDGGEDPVFTGKLKLEVVA